MSTSGDVRLARTGWVIGVVTVLTTTMTLDILDVLLGLRTTIRLAGSRHSSSTTAFVATTAEIGLALSGGVASGIRVVIARLGQFTRPTCIIT